jgi:hypothetical protein
MCRIDILFFPSLIIVKHEGWFLIKNLMQRIQLTFQFRIGKITR